MSSYRSNQNGSASEPAGRRAGGRTVGGSDHKSRAELFEDEKRRIIESCFAKKEPDGAFAESYITHLQIEEDGSSPSSPPPPDSPASNKKERVIIVAVRRSGRVRLHKARENSNSSFSIGKTWLLDHLSAIESFSGGTTTPEERQRKGWGGDTGMVITIQKPYFWKAKTMTEKEFFVASLVKIYRKYTNGKEPQLSGFSSSEMSQIGPLTAQRPRTPQSSTSRRSPSPSPGLKTGGTDFSGSGLPPDSASLPYRPPSSASSMRTAESHDRIPPLPGQFPSDTPRSLRGHDKSRSRGSQNDVFGSDSRSDTLRPPSRDNKSRGFDPASSTESFHSSRVNAQTPPAMANMDRLRSNGTYSPLARTENASDIPEPGPRSPERNNSSRKWGSSSSTHDVLPERRRPPIEEETLKRYSNETPSPIESRRGPATDGPADDAQSNRKGKDDASVKDIGAAVSEMVSPISPPPPEPEGTEQETFRPGLGPMIKKRSQKDIASSFRKAAMAANAFKPRAGGAGERLRTETSRQNSADGINGVFKAPAIGKDALRSPPPATPEDPVQMNPIDVEMEKQDTALSLRQPESRAPSVSQQEEQPQESKPVVEEPPAPIAAERKKKRPSDNSARFAEVLGIPAILLDGRTAEIEACLEDMNWSFDEKKRVKTEDLLLECRKELSKAETGTWLSSFEQGDERVSAVSKMLDKAITECDELDGLLTLYDAELGTLNEDVGHIEAQSQGLQVRTANQRILKTEQQLLLDTISIPSSQLRVLREGSLSRPDGIGSIESALAGLFKAMLTIDPSLRHQESAAFRDKPTKTDGTSSSKISSEVSAMRAVQDKKDGYRAESVDFILRMKGHMNSMFREAEATMRRSLDKDRTRSTTNQKIDLRRREKGRSQLWVYSPLMLFTREIDAIEWDGFLKMYEQIVKQHYQDEYRECFALWKQVARRAVGDEDVSFMREEKESDSLVGRKLTVKRSKTLREGPRISSADKSQDGKLQPWEAFDGVLRDTSSSIVMEQNFCSELFHVNSAGTADFSDLITMSPPDARVGNDLSAYRQFDPDRNLAKRLQVMMEDIFAFWPTDLQVLIDGTVGSEPLQGVGVLCALETKYTELEDSNQEFILHVLKQNRDRLATRFDRYIDEQIRGIEDTKVRIKKRKGVIAFIKIFPHFSGQVEQMLPSPRTDAFEVREMVNHAYRRIVKTMFESLKFIAKESPVVMAGQKGQGPGAADTEDKEVLNYHILLIENMNHYVEEVDVRNNTVLEESKREAMREMAEHMGLYLNAVLRRPLGKLLDSVESTENQIKAVTAAGESALLVASKPSHSKSIFKKVLSTYDSKEVRHGIDALKKRVDKHFGNADDPSLSRNLVAKVLRECEERYLDLLERTHKIVRDVYEGQLEVEFKKDEVVSAFRK